MNDPIEIPRDRLLIEDRLLVERIDVLPMEGVYQRVEVRASQRDDPPTSFWRSLRWKCTPNDAPRVGDVIRIVVEKQVGVADQPADEPASLQ